MPPIPPHQPQGEDIPQFPDVQAKLQKPTRQSAFDKQRAEAEAKRQREAQETAAVYQDFVKSFQDSEDPHDDDDHKKPRSYKPNLALPRNSFLPPPKPVHGLGLSKRHFGASRPSSTSAKIQPKSLSRPKANDPGPRPISKVFMGSDEDKDEGDDDTDEGEVGHYDQHGDENQKDSGNDGGGNISRTRGRPDRDPGTSSTSIRAQEKAISKPTLRLSNLPPGTSISRIKSLVTPLLSVDGVRIIPHQPPTATERRSTVAIVTLSQDTPATEIDSAVSALQHRYLGYGYHLYLHRHLSSAVASSVAAATPARVGHFLPDVAALGGSGGSSAPFGARPIAPVGGARQSQRGRFAPPPSYGLPATPTAGRGQILHVPVQPPRDISQIRLIHHVLEAMLEHGPELEALLMSRPEVQREEKWAWLWDARSQGGIWYRWKLWEIVSGFDTASSRARYLPVFEDSHAWKAPDRTLPFQNVTSVDELCSDPDFNSDDDLDMVEEGPGAETEILFLNPLGRARLAHLLSRLPTNMSRLRKGDIARVTAFAIKNASYGAEEIVDMVIWNIEKPFVLAAPEGNVRDNGARPADPEEAPTILDRTTGGDDVGAACLVGLYVINDILSSSSTSGVRHAWRYRQLFEGALKRRKVFEMLGTMPDRLNWGRLRMEKWRRSIGLVLNLWEGWCVFPVETHELFVQSFEQPASSRREQDETEGGPNKSKWKVFEAATEVADAATVTTGPDDMGSTFWGISTEQEGAATISRAEDGNGRDTLAMRGPIAGNDEQTRREEGEDVDGEPMSDDEDLDGEPMSEGDIDRERVDKDDGAAALPTATSSVGDDGRRPRKRMRAVDLFADSDGSE